MAGIARQWTDGVDLARVLHSDGEDIAKNAYKSSENNLVKEI